MDRELSEIIDDLKKFADMTHGQYDCITESKHDVVYENGKIRLLISTPRPDRGRVIESATVDVDSNTLLHPFPQDVIFQPGPNSGELIITSGRPSAITRIHAEYNRISYMVQAITRDPFEVDGQIIPTYVRVHETTIISSYSEITRSR